MKVQKGKVNPYNTKVKKRFLKASPVKNQMSNNI